MTTIDQTRLLITVNPVLVKDWHPTLNTLDLQTIYANSGKKAWWVCQTCSYEWEAVVASRNSNGRGCPNCAGKVANKTNSLQNLHPHIAAEYDPELNSKPVTQVIAHSHDKAWWRCSTDPEHSWQTPVGNRVRQGDNCPYCSGRYPTKTNNLAVKYPTVAAEFDVVKNAPLTAYDVTSATPKKFWWKCSTGHEWQVSINSRTRLGNLSGCPFCTGTKATSDNHLGVTHPKVAAEYHSSLNKTPLDKIRYGSRHLRWWQCSVNSEHVWQASVSSRTRFGREAGCPECSPTPRTSKIEVQIRAALLEVLTDVDTNYNAFVPTVNNKREAVDVYGRYGNLKVVVEYDSWWWHSGRGANKPYSVPEERDTRKTKILLESGYVVVRIRESRVPENLPLLGFDNIGFYQLHWNLYEGTQVLADKITDYLKSF